MKKSLKKHQLQQQEEPPQPATPNPIIVAMKLDQDSKELLTWTLVKVAQPGDSILALHVLSKESSDQEGKSPLSSALKAFASLLYVYESFCNLKQVDLKLKICRGDSIRKVLVHEVKAYGANKIVVGCSSGKNRLKRSLGSVVKHLAKKLPRECSVIAVGNGKVVFQRERATNGTDDRRSLGMLLAVHRNLSRNSKVSSEGSVGELNKRSYRTFGEELLRNEDDCCERDVKRNCTICARKPVSADTSDDSGVDNSQALVPVQTQEASFSYASDLIELQPGWPLLRKASVLPNCKAKDPMRKISVVQWAMQLPNRQLSLVVLDSQPKSTQEDMYQLSSLDAESGAIVPVGISFGSPRSPFDDASYSLPEELKGLQEKYSSTCRMFRYQELVEATSNFRPDKLIGKGGSSQVYRGCLPDGKELAVKILNPSEDAAKEFVLEIEIITTLHHQNIISLFGFCYEHSNLLLVYDFLSRGSLEENLHGSKTDRISFGWSERYKVALGVAEALQYLHNDSAKPVIHRDVKSSNILLSDEFEPQLSDFGFAKWASTSSLHITSTDVAGTFGYLAPEYFMYGKVTEKIDVYAYGVVLLEILSGRKPISNEHPKGQESLVMWAKPILNGSKFVELLDPILGDNYVGDEMERMALAASLCIRRTPQSRPQMGIVLKLLQGDVGVTRWARQQLVASDAESLPPSNMQSHINLALLDVEDDSLSFSSTDHCLSLESYLQGRCSRTPSFD